MCTVQLGFILIKNRLHASRARESGGAGQVEGICAGIAGHVHVFRKLEIKASTCVAFHTYIPGASRGASVEFQPLEILHNLRLLLVE